MDPFTSFILALVCTVGLALMVAGGLWRALFDLLVDICGSTTRAQFWRNYTAIVIILVPLASVMIGRADDRVSHDAFAFVDQFRWGILGLILSLCAIALVLVNSIPNPRAALKLSNNVRTDDIKRLLQKIETVEWEPGDMERLIHVMDEIRAGHVLQHTEKA